MTQNYDNDNSGALFKNRNKTQKNQPDYRGSATINGQEFWVSAWVKEAGPKSNNPGSKFFSMAYTPKDESFPEPPLVGDKKFDDDIPF